jgi:cell division septum initiation protein DivIVA
MTPETNTLTAQFPRAMRGYAPMAVDDFIRQLGARLENLQAQLDTQTDRAERLSTDLNAANQALGTYRQNETAIAGALVVSEQRRVTVEKELQEARATAKAEANTILADARRQAEAALTDAQTEADRTLSEAALLSEQTLTEVNATVEQSRVQAHEAAEGLLAEARSQAEEITAKALSEVKAQEERLQALCLEQDRVVENFRRTLEAQLELLPAPGAAVARFSREDEIESRMAVTTSVAPAYSEAA